jgi:signal transduction histidine kinase
MGWTSMLRKDTLDETTRRRAIEIVERNARSQEQLVSDILQVSQIIRGQLRLEMGEVNLVEAVTAAVESVAPTAAAKRQAITSRMPAVAVLVSGDRERLQQVFWNLLSNALKYTQRDGRIDVDLVQHEHDVIITIRDTGIGIAAHVLPHIFDRFRQGESGPGREYGGLGLGLAIVRHLTEAHGGTVTARSDGVGQGSAFTVTLPLAAAPKTPAPRT